MSKCCATLLAMTLMVLCAGIALPAVRAETFADVMAVAEWTPERFATFRDGAPLDDGGQGEIAKLLLRLQSIPGAKLAELALSGKDLDGRGRLFHLRGEVVEVKNQRLEDSAAAVLEQPAWQVCAVRLDNGMIVEVITRAVPKAWSELTPLHQPVACEAVSIRTNERGTHEFVSPHIAWYPTEPNPPIVNFGMATLGSLGVDLAEWDSPKRAGALTAEDFTAFYQTLSAMRKIDAEQLVRLARGNLASYAQPYRGELSKLGEEAARASQRGTVLREIVSAADGGRFSVWPLFLEADHQRGELVVLDGVVRRAVRIDTSIDRDGVASDALTRFGIDHYYELELFTWDSQNKPLVFCVLELPAEFPTGEDLHESVRVAGFLFKVWIFQGRRQIDAQQSDASSPTRVAREAAPLLIGRGPLRIETSTASPPWANGVVASLLATAIGCLWLMAWWFGRGDEQFERTTLAKLKSSRKPLQIEIAESGEIRD